MASWVHAWRTSPTRTLWGAGAIAFVLLVSVTEYFILGDAWRARDDAIRNLEANARLASDAKARELSQLLTDVYVTTRTISLLPAVRRPAPRNRSSADDDAIDGSRFTVNDAQTVLQLYQHLAELLSVSEVYVVYDGFAPERGEVPFLMFDSVIVDRFKRLTGASREAIGLSFESNSPEQVEDEEYAALAEQLARLRRDHPTLPPTAPQGVASLVSRALITCDNSQFLSRDADDRDRRGVLMSVPIYDAATNAFKGLVTTIVRLNVLEARLLDWPVVPVTAEERAAARRRGLDSVPPSNFVLRQVAQGIQVVDRRNAAALADIAAGRATAGLSIHTRLEGPASRDWLLEQHVPVAAYEAIDASVRRSIWTRTATLFGALLLLACGIALLVAQRRAALRLKEMADYDPLTGLPNRRQLERAMDSGIRRAAAAGRRLALVMVDLDNFKAVNDTLGHHVGDLLLVEVARRFQKQARSFDAPGAAVEAEPMVGRLGGDEFLIVLPDADDESTACALAERLLSALAVPAIIDGQALQVRASMGVAIYPDHGHSAAQLLRCADQAMYSAKRVDDSAVVVFQRDIDHAAMRRLRLTGDLRHALSRGEFELHYQAIVNLARQRADSAEALLRWHHPEFGAVGPAEFVPLLERSGLIVPVGLWVLREACRQLRAWRATGSHIESISVNVSVVQLAQSDFSLDALEVVRHSGIDPSHVTIEVTESVLMDNAERSVGQLHALRAAGLRVAIDDFGAGYSSLGYLRRLPVQVIKVDRTLLVDAVNPNGRAILASMVDLAAELGLDCIVEGVETIEQYRLLFDIGCQRLQGYLFARPLRADEAEAAARRLEMPDVWMSGSLFTESCFGRLERRSGFAPLGA